MKSKLKGAQTGHDLLKRKSEALTKRFRDITRRIADAKEKMGKVMQIAAFSLAEVTYATGNNSIGYQITETAREAKFRVRTKQENVSGVFLPQFESFTVEGVSDFGMTGLGRGGQQVAKCRETYTRAVETLIELASLQTAFVILDDVIKVVNRRVNAMYVLFEDPSPILFYESFTERERLITDTISSSQRTRHHSPDGKYYQIHQLGTRRTRSRGILPVEESQGCQGACTSGGGAGEKEESRPCIWKRQGE
jgi:H(+)-transporting ATP synthase subunit D